MELLRRTRESFSLAMKRGKRHTRFVLTGVGILLVASGLLVAYWWHYRLAPMRRLADPSWLAAHSESARWKEEQKDYRRMGSSPDLCFRGDRIGYYGDKQWFLWLEEQIRNPESFRHCGCTEFALALMANRYDSSWEQWADANRGRSQEEWIRDGFLDFGATVHLPPTPDDTLLLLRLLSRKSWNVLWAGSQGTNAPNAVPNYIQYNAYRWLRDSGFDPSEFDSSNPISTEADITQGLVRYSQWKTAFPGNDMLGVLAFGRSSASSSDADVRPIIAKSWIVLGVDALIAVCILGGAVLVLCFKKRKSDLKLSELEF